ncbi:MAG: threonylcarbamoyl-AMP synthase [Desulfovibrionales bacterium]|nr:threonylcarbamoyl-AMP synthase [Desulfovibrionales bacterium]
MNNTWQKGADALRQGRLVVYPTETFYALGCLATLPRAVERVMELKGRPGGKPLPLIIADWDMSEQYLHLSGLALTLARTFWPGSLSIVTEVEPCISPLARDDHGRSAVRMTPHPIARELCRGAGVPLISSSANRSGNPPVFLPQDLDPVLVDHAVVIDARPWPQGGKASTLVEVVDKNAVRILREGVLTAQELAAAGYVLVG